MKADEPLILTEPAEMTVIPMRSLHRKLAQVMYEAERIPKNGTAPREMGGYKFVQVGDAADYIRKALAEKIITMMPTRVTVVGQQDRPTKSGGSMTTVDLLVDWTITDGESGETIVLQSFGAGADGGDKYSGKASTSAMKYALLSGFLLSTGEDTELGTDTAADRSVPGAPRIISDRRPPAAVIAEVAAASPFQTSEQGVVEFAKSGPADGELRSSPQGPFLVFRFVGKESVIPQVAAYGPLAEALSTLRRASDFLAGMEVIVSGVIDRVPFPNGGTRTFQRMTLSRLERLGPDGWVLPAPTIVPDEPAEAESLPLGLDEAAELENLDVPWPVPSGA